MLTREEFEAEKVRICGSGPPSTGDNLLGMEMDCFYYLGDPMGDPDAGFDLWQDMTVSMYPGQEWLIAGIARVRHDAAAAIEASLSRIWKENLSYTYREAHTVERTDDGLALLAVTQIGPGELWVTAKVTVQLTV